MLLENKNAVIYGEGGSIGGAVARELSETFSWETLAAVDSKCQD
jgi:hypothetical protein